MRTHSYRMTNYRSENGARRNVSIDVDHVLYARLERGHARIVARWRTGRRREDRL
jgi:hypothetical protein